MINDYPAGERGYQAPVNTNLLAQDLDHILAHTEGLWEELRGQRVFITGGTGLFGCWLLESFTWANEKLKLGAKVVVLSRNPEAFSRKVPHLVANRAISLHSGDVRDFEFPQGTFSHIIHAATESTTNLNEANPLAMLDVIVQGTRRTLDFVVACGAKKFLLTSSGAVYGRNVSQVSHIPEDYAGGPDPVNPASAYDEGKRVAEFLCAIYHKQHGLQTIIARCFAVVGPYLPLDIHFAIGNFIRDAVAGGPIRINGDGTPYRSYLYTADLAIWLWTILIRGKACWPYNVGSEEDLNIRQLAETVAEIFEPASQIIVSKAPTPGQAPIHYVPATSRAQTDLGLRQTVNLREAIRRTVAWNKAQTKT